MFFGGNDGFADDVREVRADDEIHRYAKKEQGRPCGETSTDAKKTATDPDDESDDDQVNGIDVGARRSGNP